MVWVLSLSTMDLVTHSLTAMFMLTGIRSLIGFGNRVWPLVLPDLYLRQETHDASPKAISGRTSYNGI